MLGSNLSGCVLGFNNYKLLGNLALQASKPRPVFKILKEGSLFVFMF